MFRQLLVPVDFSPCSRLAVGQACAVARATGGTVTLLHVLEHPNPEGTLQAQALEVLGHLGLPARRPPQRLALPAEPDVAGTILKAAHRLRSDLILIGLHGRPEDDPAVLGSVVWQVLQGATVPVHVVPGTLMPRPPLGRWQTLVGGT